MPKPLPLGDFRARRIVLTRNDFAFAPGPEARPSDPIKKGDWQGIVTLPDDVAVRTSNHHGSELALLYDLWGEWIGAVGEKQDTLYDLMLDAADDFQAATFNSLCGFYRLCFSALRSALELVVIGAFAQASRSPSLIQGWRAGTERAALGKACDGLMGITKPPQVGTLLFAQRRPTTAGGVVRELFQALSHYSHSRPGYTDSDFRESNGPIYVRGAFRHCTKLHTETVALCFLFAKIARPTFPRPIAVEALVFKAKSITSPTRAAWEQLFGTT